MKKTPFYEATQADRYGRQSLIESIESTSGRQLICHVSGSGVSIDRDDVLGFADLLHNVNANADLDLLLHTGGGDMDAAEKLIKMVRDRVGEAILRVVVPDFAKSSGTLMALGADLVVMGNTSELGPIDPQITVADENGNRIRHSIQSYLSAYKTLSDSLKANPNDIAAQIMLEKLNPATIKLYEAAMRRARVFAEQQLQRGMFREGGPYTATASALLDTKRWQSHGQMISWEDAQHETVGLSVEYLAPENALWEKYWKLYCLQRLAIADRQKLYESKCVSITVGSAAKK